MSAQLNLYDIWNPKIRANPQALYEQMRSENPIYAATGPVTSNTFWFFTRYRDCVTVLKDQRFGKDARKHLPGDMLLRYGFTEEDSTFAAINRHMLNLDQPDHTRLRALVHKAFTPRMVDELRPRIQEIADELLNAMADQKEFNLIEQFSFPLPITVIAEMLGVPSADRDKFRDWTTTLLFGNDMDRASGAVLEFVMYMNELIEDRQKSPREDLLSGLIHVEENGDTLNREELLSMIFLLLVAGHETTVNLIANGVLALIQHPDQMQKLVDDPGLIHSAVEGMLRFNGPVETPTIRFAFEEVEVSGVTIPFGAIIMPSLLGANRDPEIFPEPNRFDITRDPNRHIAFGSGIHYCLGAPLARMEGSIAISSLLQRFPHLELNTALDELVWNENLLIHGMKALPLRHR